MKYFAFNKNVLLVSGAKRGAIYDLNNKRIFSIDETSKGYLEKLTAGQSIEEITLKLTKLDKDELIQYLQLLCDKELAYLTNKKIISGKYNINNIEIDKKIHTVWFELRKACNLRCCHCYLDSNIHSDEKLDVLTLSDWKRIIDELEMYNPRRIILIGGEPLLFCEINELIEYCRNKLKDSSIVLYSNITMLNNENIKVIVDNNVKVITSIYSNEAKIHDKITQTKGSFYKTISNIKKLKQLGVYVKANIVAMKYNYDNISDILKFTYELTGVKSKIDIIRNVGEDKKDLLPTDYEKNSIEKKLILGINKEKFYRNLSGNSCYQGKINISCDGLVTPCIMSNKLANSKYNIKRYSINSILEKYLIPEFWSLSKDYIDECKDCEYRYACKDCRPISISDNNKYEKGNNCNYNPYTSEN